MEWSQPFITYMLWQDDNAQEIGEQPNEIRGVGIMLWEPCSEWEGVRGDEKFIKNNNNFEITSNMELSKSGQKDSPEKGWSR